MGFFRSTARGNKGNGGEITKAIMTGILTPDWSYVSLPDGEDLLHGLIDTLAIAILGTFISAFLSVPFAFWAATNMSSGKLTSGFGKFVLSFVRTFPELVMALLFIKAVGPGSFAGVLALGLHSIGMLGKLYSEGIENIDKGPTEALLATGANRFQILWYAVLPQVLPDFLSYTLYRFEINVRSACDFRSYRSRRDWYTFNFCAEFTELVSCWYYFIRYYFNGNYN